MPTRKQRRRLAKGRRHEYETVWVDAEGNELEEPPEEAVAATREQRDDKARPAARTQQTRGGRQVRVPPPPSWQRAARRSLILGVVIFAAFYLIGGKNGGSHRLTFALELAVVYTALFIPFTYVVDRWTHNRWQRRAEQRGQKGPTKKR